MKKNTKPRRLLALLLVLTLALGMIPLSATAASQENVYHDPAENWLEGGSRADTFTQNATRTYGTMQCRYCTIEQNGSVTQPLFTLPASPIGCRSTPLPVCPTLCGTLATRTAILPPGRPPT